MATTLFLRSTAAVGEHWNDGVRNTKLNGSASNWIIRGLSTTRGGGVVASNATATVAGATNGVEVVATGSAPLYWTTAPLAADVTISGSIAWNLWASESNMSANVAINGRLEVIDGATGAFTLIDQTARVTEVAVTTRAVNNFAETPAAGVACKRGDRLRVRIFGDDAGTMASGFTFDASWNGATGGADGDTFLTLTENLTFETTPAGSQVFLTDTASDVGTASTVDREAWTSRGAGVVNDVTDTAAGPLAAPGTQVTDTAGGTAVEWFTKQLTAFTLGGAALVNIRAVTTDTSLRVGTRCEVAVVNSNGSSATVWATNVQGVDSAAENVLPFWVSGDDLAVTAGQRLRIRIYADDWPPNGDQAATFTLTTHYAGTTGGASGDTFLTFTQTLTEDVVVERVPHFRPYTQLLAH